MGQIHSSPAATAAASPSMTLPVPLTPAQFKASGFAKDYAGLSGGNMAGVNVALTASGAQVFVDAGYFLVLADGQGNTIAKMMGPASQTLSGPMPAMIGVGTAQHTNGPVKVENFTNESQVESGCTVSPVLMFVAVVLVILWVLRR